MIRRGGGDRQSGDHLLSVPSLLWPSIDLLFLLAGPLVAYGLVVAPEFRLDRLDPLRTIAVGLGTLVILEWSAIALVMLLAKRGQRYVRKLNMPARSKARLDERPHSITIAGLVFAAAVFLDQPSRPAEAVELLTVSAMAYLVSWLTGFQPHRPSSGILSDGLQWVGLAALFAAMSSFAASAPMQLLVDLSLFILALYSWENARGFLIEAGIGRSNPRPGTAPAQTRTLPHQEASRRLPKAIIHEEE